ncbi:MAG: Flp family type IVb pilin, partial [Pirellula sp.]
MFTPQKTGSRRASARFLKEDDGTSAMEYAVMLSLIGATLVPVVQTLGQKVSGITQGDAEALATPPHDAPHPNPGF